MFQKIKSLTEIDIRRTEGSKMFKLPVCPYCNTVYDYKEVRKNKKKKIKCYHCNKIFRRSRKNYIFLFFIMSVIAILINIGFFIGISDFTKSIVPVFINSIVIVIIGLFFKPFFVKYKK